MVLTVRVRAVNADVPVFVAREGVYAAEIHGRTTPAVEEGPGDRIVTNVPLFDECVALTDGEGNGAGLTVRADALAVQAVRWRSERWAAKVSRVVEGSGEGRFGELRKASPWVSGEWNGDTTLSADWRAFGLPPEANPA